VPALQVLSFAPNRWFHRADSLGAFPEVARYDVVRPFGLGTFRWRRPHNVKPGTPAHRARALRANT